MAKIDFNTPVTTLRGQDITMQEYEGDVLLIVNTASKCGLTPQYEGLEALHQELEGQGLKILGFPCNQFGAQEPGSADDIAEFCQINYGVSFPMHAKIKVNGDDTHPLYQQLKTAAPGLLGSKKIKWNFTKFLVGRDGTILERFAPTTKPAAIKAKVQEVLGA